MKKCSFYGKNVWKWKKITFFHMILTVSHNLFPCIKIIMLTSYILDNGLQKPKMTFLEELGLLVTKVNTGKHNSPSKCENFFHVWKNEVFNLKTFINSLKTTFFHSFIISHNISLCVKTAVLTSDIVENGFCWQPIHMWHK